MTANEAYFSGTEKELEEFCDRYFVNDSDMSQLRCSIGHDMSNLQTSLKIVYPKFPRYNQGLKDTITIFYGISPQNLSSR